ncbi:hypothetical protein CXF68_18330 [Tenacibaculum sp. Bg11-29]|uniref:hypothetical protein n=1 Tax=Tenacibaculum sp. Bg11-29 TaxID=2058306 RepID=UPI000C324FF9|nr:hypothetical protein [Tenacibaculum sp. Bg11-29]PKH52534.1 hypothetical protein CXF68_18330 [Tenacibaculum sp. Bg11-29]
MKTLENIKTETIQVLKTNNQEASLNATYNSHSQIEDPVFNFKLNGLNATKWELTYSEVAIIFARKEVSVQEKSEYPSLGLFSIGKNTNWLYNHNLWEQPKDLESAIYKLLEFSLTGK